MGKGFPVKQGDAAGKGETAHNRLQALTAGSHDKKRTPTMLAGPVGVARLL